jgi:hypothetical protein
MLLQREKRQVCVVVVTSPPFITTIRPLFLFLNSYVQKDKYMFLKGLILGFVAEAGSYALKRIEANPGEAPLKMFTSWKFKLWFYFSVGVANLTLLVWIPANFFLYSVEVGFIAIGGTLLGVFASRLISQNNKNALTYLLFHYASLHL